MSIATRRAARTNMSKRTPPPARPCAFQPFPAGLGPQSGCLCHFCGSELRYPDFREGQILLCELCGMETVADGGGSDRRLLGDDLTVSVNGVRWHPGMYGVGYLVGSVASQAAVGLDWIKIEFKLYDHLDIQVGTASDHRRGFGAGYVWTFKAPVFNSRACRAPLSDVTCEYGSIYHPTISSCLAAVTWPPAEPASPLKDANDSLPDALPRFA